MKARYVVFFTVTMIVLVLGLLKGLRPDEILNVQALFIVFGGTSMVLLVGFPQKRVIDTCKAVKKALFLKKHEEERDKILKEVLRLARIYRIHGPIALERAAKKIENDFLRFGASLVAEGYDRASLNAALEIEASARHSERISQIRLIKTLTRLTPALGMAGTVVSLMQVMGTLNQPDQAGPALGLALSSTLYGLLLANLLFLPLATKLQELAEKCQATAVYFYTERNPKAWERLINTKPIGCMFVLETRVKNSEVKNGEN